MSRDNYLKKSITQSETIYVDGKSHLILILIIH